MSRGKWLLIARLIDIDREEERKRTAKANADAIIEAFQKYLRANQG